MQQPCDRPIFLIGYRGTGKTTVARELAARLGLRLGRRRRRDRTPGRQDRSRRSSPTTAKRRFAIWKRESSPNLCGRSRDCRGAGRRGRAARGQSRGHSRRRTGRLADGERRHDRSSGSPPTRPPPSRRPNLTAAGGRAEIETLLAERTPIYRACATLVVDTEGKTPAEVADEIVGAICERRSGTPIMDGLDDPALAATGHGVLSWALCLGSLVNWAIYTLAWNPRPISPWSRVPPRCTAATLVRSTAGVGLARLRREARFTAADFGCGRCCWSLAWARRWRRSIGGRVVRAGLDREASSRCRSCRPLWPLSLAIRQPRAAAVPDAGGVSFIDIDEKIIPDEITVTGTMLGLVLATRRADVAVAACGRAASAAGRGRSVRESPTADQRSGLAAATLWLEPVTIVAPHWPGRRHGRSRDIGRRWRSALACYWLWCFALAPRIWRGRRGPVFALAIDRRPRAAASSRGRRCAGCSWSGTAAIVFALGAGRRRIGPAC